MGLNLGYEYLLATFYKSVSAFHLHELKTQMFIHSKIRTG
jgi:hypothetical protein